MRVYLTESFSQTLQASYTDFQLVTQAPELSSQTFIFSKRGRTNAADDENCACVLHFREDVVQL